MDCPGRGYSLFQKITHSHIPMKKIYITLNHKSRFMAPKVGEFRYLDRHQRLLWKSRPFETTEELSDEMNNALEYVERYAITPARVRFISLEEPDQEQGQEASPSQNQTPEAINPPESTEGIIAEFETPKRGRGRPPKKNLAKALAALT